MTHPIPPSPPSPPSPQSPPPQWNYFSWTVIAAIPIALLSGLTVLLAVAFGLSLMLALMTATLWLRLTPWQRARGLCPAVVMMLVPVLIITWAMLTTTPAS